MRSNFIDKVYDTYISSDFDYGDDNLNPVREIDLSSTKSMDDRIAEIYAELTKRVENVKKTVEDITGSEESEIFKGNTVSESNNNIDDSHKKNMINLTGSSGDKIVVIPFFNEDMDPITLELELMLLEKTLQAYYPDDTGGGTTTSGGGGGLTTIDIPPFNPDCTIIMNPGSTGNQMPVLEDSVNMSYNEDDFEGGGGSSGESDAGDGSLNSDEINIDAAKLADAMDDALAAAEKASQRNEKEQAECAKAEIDILKMILAVLKVIKTIKQIMDPAFTLIMQAIKIVQLASQCWNNPTCIGVIIQRVLGTVIAVLMGFVSELLAQIWKMLGMDCFTEEAQAVMDAIREALSAIGNITSQLNPTSIIFELKEAIGSVENTFDTVADSIKNFKDNAKDIDNAAQTALRNILDTQFPGLTDEDFASFIANKRYRERVLETIAQADPKSVKLIRRAVDEVLTIPEEAVGVAEMYDNVSKLVSNLSTEQQFTARLSNLQRY